MGAKINLICGYLKVVAALVGLPPRKAFQGYKRPQAPSRPKKRNSPQVLLSSQMFSTHFSSLTNTKNTQKNTSKFFDSSLFTKSTRYCFYTQSSSPWFYTLDLGFKGVDVAFQLLSTPLTFQIFFQPLSCSFCLNNMIYCFLQHVSCFICASSLNLLDFYALCHVSCLDLRPYMLICLDLHVLCYKPCFPMLCSSFCSRLMLGLHAHMLV